MEIHSSKGFRLPKFQSSVLGSLSKGCSEEVCTYKEINEQASKGELKYRNSIKKTSINLIKVQAKNQSSDHAWTCIKCDQNALFFIH